jgi:hypothetical protein
MSILPSAVTRGARHLTGAYIPTRACVEAGTEGPADQAFERPPCHGTVGLNAFLFEESRRSRE